MLEFVMQIGEHFSFAVDFTPKLPPNAALVSGRLLATRKGKTQTTFLVGALSPGTMTLSLADNVQSGAMLTLNTGQADEEPLLVLSVSGTGPYVATLASPVQLAHATGESVKYDLGASNHVLASTTATVSGALMKANLVGGLVYEYVVIFLATLTTGEVIRQDVNVIVED